tara:strand:+ start:2064 stop:2774 length:711 start_codon:yes stop_codon:yes gene_type:complete
MKNIIYIVNINNPNYGKLCIKSWKKWADKNNCEVVVLEEPFSNIEPHWYKTFPFQLLENSDIDYDRVLVVDNDTLVHPNCPNFFNLVSENEIGVVLDDTNFDWTIRSTDAYHKHIFNDFDRFDTFEYFNSGFLVLSKQHKQVYDNIITFLKENYETLNWVQENYGVGRDQTPLNFLLRKFSKVKHISKRFNCQGLVSKELVEPKKIAKMCYVSHYNAISREHRYTLMERVYNYLYE